MKRTHLLDFEIIPLYENMNKHLARENLFEPKMMKEHYFKAWFVCFVSSLFVLYNYMQATLFNSLSVDLMRTFHIQAQETGFLSAIYLFAVAIISIPLGLALDRYSTKKLTLITLGVCVAGAWLFAFAPTLWVAQIARFIGGLGGSFALLGSFVLITRWIPPNKIGLVTGLVITMAIIGGCLSQTPMVLLSQSLGWRGAVLSSAGFGIVIWLLIAIFVQDYPKTPTFQNRHPTMPKEKNLLKAMRYKEIWLGSLYNCMLSYSIVLFGAIWGNHYLVEIYYLSAFHASFIIIMLYLGDLIGSLTYGWISDRIRNRKWLMILGAAISVILILLLLYKNIQSATSLTVIFFLLGFTSSSSSLSHSLIIKNVPQNIIGTAQGLAGVIIILSAALIQPFSGWIVDLSPGQEPHDVFSEQNYHIILLMVLVGAIIGFIISIFIRDKSRTNES